MENKIPKISDYNNMLKTFFKDKVINLYINNIKSDNKKFCIISDKQNKVLDVIKNIIPINTKNIDITKIKFVQNSTHYFINNDIIINLEPLNTEYFKIIENKDFILVEKLLFANHKKFILKFKDGSCKIINPSKIHIYNKEYYSKLSNGKYSSKQIEDFIYRSKVEEIKDGLKKYKEFMNNILKNKF